MVMLIEPLAKAIAAAKARAAELDIDAPVIYLSPQGQRFDEAATKQLALHQGLILLCGRYEGVDERLIERLVDAEWSIGDYVLSGGELPAMVIIDAISRRIEGVLGDKQSAEQDSFVSGLLDCPHYTRPEIYDGEAVPAVLLSGNHAQIQRWRWQQSLKRTLMREAGNHEDYVLKQLSSDLFDFELSELTKLSIAYEPIWAIGTGKTASPEEAQAMHLFIRNTIFQQFGSDLAHSMSILYGGSVKANNAGILAFQNDIDGFLVGGASLDPEEFASIVSVFH